MVQSFKLAVNAILSNKIRSSLTMLGIIIGVAAVIILVSIVSGYTGQMISQFEEMGVNVLKDDEGYDVLVDIDNDEDKRKVIEFIDNLLS